LKKSLLFGLVVQFFSTIFFAFGSNYWILLFARALQGFSSGITWVAGFAMIGDKYPANEQGLVVGQLESLSGAGVLLGIVNYPILFFYFINHRWCWGNIFRVTLYHLRL
jgi:MFS family permease